MQASGLEDKRQGRNRSTAGVNFRVDLSSGSAEPLRHSSTLLVIPFFKHMFHLEAAHQQCATQPGLERHKLEYRYSGNVGDAGA